MTRPEYETEADRVAEREIMEHVARVVYGSGINLCKLSKAYGLDYALATGRDVFAFFETKSRTLPFNYKDGYYIAAIKVMAAKRLRASFGLPCELAVRFSDGIIRRVSFGLASTELILAGRWDRDDPNDIEPHAIIKWDCFTEC